MEVEIITIPNYDRMSAMEILSAKITEKTYVDSEDALKLREMYIDAQIFTADTDYKEVLTKDKNIVHLMNQHFSLGMSSINNIFNNLTIMFSGLSTDRTKIKYGRDGKIKNGFGKISDFNMYHNVKNLDMLERYCENPRLFGEDVDMIRFTQEEKDKYIDNRLYILNFVNNTRRKTVVLMELPGLLNNYCGVEVKTPEQLKNEVRKSLTPKVNAFILFMYSYITISFNLEKI